MSYRDWLRPPRHLIALFLLLTLMPSLLLMAFGWRLLRQDLELERQQADAAGEQAADVIVAALEQSVASLEQTLREGGPLENAAAEDALAVVFTPGGLDAFPSNRLLFLPVALPGPEAVPAVFAGGETIEFRDGNPVRAAAWFRNLARSPSAPVRAGALIRLARNLRKAGDPDGALAVYAQVREQDAAVGRVPAELLARWARCDLLNALGRRAELQQEARLLAADLGRGRWRIDRAQFTMHLADARGWSGEQAAPGQAEAIAMATSVESLFQQWRRVTSGSAFSGRAARTVDGVLHTLLWQGSAERAAAFIAGPRYMKAQWIARPSSLEERHNVRASLIDPAVRGSSTHVRRRSAAETGLPWTVLVDGTGTVAGGAFAGRRAIWLAGLGIVGLLVISGTYVVVRAVSREFAVARLQSDFVSAVSHEFRTPLTSLRQLSEMLIDRPAAPIDRRQAYYAALARQTDRLTRLVESLLDFGRMEAGTTPYRLATLDVTALVRDIVQQFEADPAARDCEVRLQVPDSAATVSGDRDAITNALWNLLDNAVKYSPESTVVWVDVATDVDAAVIRVRDQGLGIPAAEQREIFGKFVRGATARAGNISGTGIGLAMVSHIMAAHKGSVTVESEPGAGSTFTMRLPLLHAAASSMREGAWLGS